jgi:cytoskeletal protein RodZ
MAKRKKDSEEQNDNLNENNGGEDNFGLPDIDYKPLDQVKEEAPVEPEPVVQEEVQQTSHYSPDDRPKESEFSSYAAESEGSKAPVIIGLVIAMVVVVAGYLIYQYVYLPQAEKERKELAAKAAEKKKKEEEARLAREREAEEARLKAEADAAAKATPASGEIISLSEKTGRYYVVVASAVDGDLIMDHAKKLSAKGTGSKIIPPFGKWKYYRLAISDHDTFADAQGVADQSKAEYGDATWVIKY